MTASVDRASIGLRSERGPVLGALMLATGLIAVDATINGRHYARGTIAKLRPGNVEVIAGGKKQFITFRASCTLRDAPELGCYL
jgi:hypothetical protein